MAVVTRSQTVELMASTRTLLGWGALLTYVLLWSWRASVSESPRNTAFRAILVTFWVLIFVIALEMCAALGVVNWGVLFRSASRADDSYMTSFVTHPDGWFQRPSGAHWTTRPQSDLEMRWGLPASIREPITFTFDAKGYRNVSDLERADIALLGDSYVEGAYVSDDQTTARLLEAEVARPVVNLGVAGFGPSYELRALMRDAAPLQPRVVVWFFFEGNDLYDPDLVPQDTALVSLPPPPPRPAWRETVRFFTDRSVRRERGFTPNFLWQLSTWTHPLFPNHIPDYGFLSLSGQEEQRVYFGDYGAVPWTSYEEQRWTEMEGIFRSGSEFARDRGMHLLLVYVPIKFRVYQPLVTFPERSRLREWRVWPLPDRFRDFCLRSDLACLDLTETFRQSAREGHTPYAVTDTHWGPDGHRIAATAVVDELRDRDWLRIIEAR
jgi:hypothetical protein